MISIVPFDIIKASTLIFNYFVATYYCDIMRNSIILTFMPDFRIVYFLNT